MPLRKKAVEIYMNTIGRITGHRRVSKENANLRHQLAEYQTIATENAHLRQELTKVHPQNSDNSATYQPKSNVNKTLQLDFPTINVQNPQTIPKSPNPINPMPVTPTIVVSQSGATSYTNPSDVMNEEEALRAEVDRYREENEQLLARYEKLNEEMKRKKIESFEDLASQDKETMKIFLELARLTQPIPLDGVNIGLFGITSTGKSTMLNTLLGEKLAETGFGETTIQISSYPGEKYTLWDVPGRNDEISYFTMEYISFFKGLTKRLILIQATIKENSSLMRLLDEIGLDYDIVFNKFDKVEEEERDGIQKLIRSEIETLRLKGVKKLYFVSAKQPKMFPDWIEMINYLESSS